MNRFYLRLALALTATVALTAVTASAAMAGMTAPAILAGTATVVAIASTWSVARSLVRAMTGYVTALESGDSTVRVSTGRTTPAELAATMNRLAAIYSVNTRDLETRKLYYDRILRIMTHEMRNAITPVIALSTDMTERPADYSGTEALTEAAGVIRAESMGIKRFLDSYYELTHLPAPELTTFAATEFLSSLGESAGCVIEVARDLRITADRSLLTRAVTNLLRNAREAARSLVTFRATATPDGTQITITDDGPGIPPEVMERLFQPFFTTKEGGSGIGLFLSRQIAALHGGTLRLTSTPSGTTATLTLKN